MMNTTKKSTSGIFGVIDHTSLFEKCVFEIKEIQELDYPQYDYALMNLALGLNHLFEWHLKNKEIPVKDREECVLRFNPFETPYDVSRDFKEIYKQLAEFPKTNRQQLTIRQLCNRAKHLKPKPEHSSEKNYTATCGTATCGESTCGEFNRYNYFVRGESVEELCSDLINEWKKFLNLE